MKTGTYTETWWSLFELLSIPLARAASATMLSLHFSALGVWRSNCQSVRKTVCRWIYGENQAIDSMSYRYEIIILFQIGSHQISNIQVQQLSADHLLNAHGGITSTNSNPSAIIPAHTQFQLRLFWTPSLSPYPTTTFRCTSYPHNNVRHPSEPSSRFKQILGANSSSSLGPSTPSRRLPCKLTARYAP
jgi:hypothetical protein